MIYSISWDWESYSRIICWPVQVWPSNWSVHTIRPTRMIKLKLSYDWMELTSKPAFVRRKSTRPIKFLSPLSSSANPNPRLYLLSLALTRSLKKLLTKGNLDFLHTDTVSPFLSLVNLDTTPASQPFLVSLEALSPILQLGNTSVTWSQQQVTRFWNGSHVL